MTILLLGVNLAAALQLLQQGAGATILGLAGLVAIGHRAKDGSRF